MTKDEARVIKAIQQLDEERKRRIAAERRAGVLRAVIERMQREKAAQADKRAPA
jgi:hypothetical protein